MLTASSRIKNRTLDTKILPLWIKSSSLPGVHVIMSMPDIIILNCSFTGILPMTSAFLKSIMFLMYIRTRIRTTGIVSFIQAMHSFNTCKMKYFKCNYCKLSWVLFIDERLYEFNTFAEVDSCIRNEHLNHTSNIIEFLYQLAEIFYRDPTL